MSGTAWEARIECPDCVVTEGWNVDWGDWRALTHDCGCGGTVQAGLDDILDADKRRRADR